MFLFFDVETTGLPNKNAYSYKDLSLFQRCRIVSFSWQYLDKHLNTIEEGYFVIKPEFTIHEDSIKIHGITNEIAQEIGIPFLQFCQNTHHVLQECKVVISHNLNFDLDCVLSEFYRRKLHMFENMILKKKGFCTMVNGKKIMQMSKYPKLQELYSFLFQQVFDNAHNSYWDTQACKECFILMSRRNFHVV